MWDSVEPSRSGLHRRGDSRALRLQEEYRFQTLAPGQAAQFHALGQIESPSSSRDRDPPRRYEPKTGSLPAPPARASCSAFPFAPPPNRPHSDAAVLTRDATGPASVPFRRHSPLLSRPLNESPSIRRVSRPRSPGRTVGTSGPLLLPATPTEAQNRDPGKPWSGENTLRAGVEAAAVHKPHGDGSKHLKSETPHLCGAKSHKCWRGQRDATEFVDGGGMKVGTPSISGGPEQVCIPSCPAQSPTQPPEEPHLCIG